MPELILPETYELEYHAKLLGDARTMAFRPGTVDFPEEQYDRFCEYWFAEENPAERMFRLIYCEGCGYFVGEVSYERVAEDSAELTLIIQKDLRESGYGGWTLKEIARIAQENGIRTLRVTVNPETNESLEFLLKRGFSKIEKDAEKAVLCASCDKLAKGEKRALEEICCCCRKKAE
ncbi:MAG: GNAT family N-acetyltransferase [Erysipelotrichaceae bacterium]|nr:GNAT family N-acetyltransferase [Erysipelotrichaceae bacterium]